MRQLKIEKRISPKEPKTLYIVSFEEATTPETGMNPKDIERLIVEHRDKLLTRIFFRVKNLQYAEDLLHDTIIKVMKQMTEGKYREEGNFLAWTTRIASNLAVDNTRKSNRMPTTSGSEDFDIFEIVEETDMGSADQFMNLEEELLTSNKLKELIELLPEKQKEVLKMRHWEDMSFKEIGEETNVSINTALGRMRYALIYLREIIEEKNVRLRD